MTAQDLAFGQSVSDCLRELSDDQQEQLAELLESYVADREAGRSKDLDGLINNHPDLAAALRWHLEGIDFLHIAAQEFGLQHIAESREFPGQVNVLGDFEIVREVGRGGMGIVYEARQISLGRRTALKILPFASVLDQRQIDRFHNEARAAAQLHHPNIVPVHSVGCERGVHYYSMQYIEGQSLEQLIEQLRGGGSGPGVSGHVLAEESTSDDVGRSTAPSIRRRNHIWSAAELASQAAGALHHAHSFGVVHRDVKPSNLILDEAGKLWVTDFGLARCQTDTHLTATGDLLGTVRYMSPEAAGGRGELVDHRSDVYSLGITLYELLTLDRPHSAVDRQELLNQICHEDAPPPRRINDAIPIDLETIILKAIAKSRDERYGSALELMQDLQRFLEGTQPLAKRPSRLDQIITWTSRHRRSFLMIMSGLFFATVAAASTAVLVTLEKKKTEIALAEAKHSFQQSQFHLNKTIEVVDRFGIRLADQLRDIPEADAIRQSLLLGTVADYQHLASELNNEPAMAFPLAVCHAQIASMKSRLGDLTGALKSYATAIDVYNRLEQQVDSENPNSKLLIRIQYDKSACLNNAGELHLRLGDLGPSEEMYLMSIAIARQCVRKTGSVADRHLLAVGLCGQGSVYVATDRRKMGERVYREAIAILRGLANDPSDAAVFNRELARAYAQLSLTYFETDVEEAMKWNLAATRLYDEQVRRLPQDPYVLSELANCYNHRGTILRRKGEKALAKDAHERAIELLVRLRTRDPEGGIFQEQLAIAHNNLGQLLATDDTTRDSAIVQFEQARILLVGSNKRSGRDGRNEARLGCVLASLATLIKRQDPNRAEELFNTAIHHQSVAYDASPQVAQYGRWLDSSLKKYVGFLRESNRHAEAATVSLQRRSLVETDAQSLFQIAKELTSCASMLGATRRKKVIQDAADIWIAAFEQGLVDPEATLADPKLSVLKSHPAVKRAVTDQIRSKWEIQ